MKASRHYLRLALLSICLLFAFSALCFEDNPKFEKKNSNKIKHSLNGKLDDSFYKDFKALTDDNEIDLYEFEYDLFKLINDYRKENKLDAIIWNDNMARLNKLRSIYSLANPPTAHEMKGVGGLLKGTAKKYGIPLKGYSVENLGQAGGTTAASATPEKMFKTWVDSPLHNENLLNPKIKYGAVACVGSNNIMDAGYLGVYATFAAIS